MISSFLQKASWALFLTVAGFLTSTGSAEPSTNAILAKLGDKPIYEADFARFTQGMFTTEQQSNIETNATARREAVNAYLDLMVLCTKARHEGIDKSTNFVKARELMEMKQLSRLMIEQQREALNRATVVTEQELRNYYDRHFSSSTNEARRSFADVKETITSELTKQKTSATQQSFIQQVYTATKLQEMPSATNDTFVLNPRGIKTNDVLATLGGKEITEADFEWFARDAYPVQQRERAFSRPGIRIGMVKSYLTMRALEARARQLKLDKTLDYQCVVEVEEMRLLGEFLQQRDGTTPWLLPGKTQSEKDAALNVYLAKLRTEVGLQKLAEK